MTQNYGFQDLLDQVAMLSVDAQARLDDVTGEGTEYGGPVSGDIDKQQFTFNVGGENPLQARCHWVGSAAPGPNSWLWGFENVNSFSDGAIAGAIRIREFGETYSIDELSTAEIPLKDAPEKDAALYGMLATGILNYWPHVVLPMGGGTAAVLLIEHELLRWQEPTVSRVLQVITDTAETGRVKNWRPALQHYARVRRLGIDEQDDVITLTLPDGGTVVLELDSNSLPSTVTGSSPESRGGGLKSGTLEASNNREPNTLPTAEKADK